MAAQSIQIAYGNSTLAVEPGPWIRQVIIPNMVEGRPLLDDLLRGALDNPIGSPFLRDLAGPDDKVAILLSDPARKFPKQEMFLAVLKELEQAGVPDRNITLIIACGMHAKKSDDQAGLSEDLLKRFSPNWHDCRSKDLGFIGLTPQKRDWPGYLSYLRKIAKIQLRDPMGSLSAFVSEIRRRDKEALKFRRAFSLPSRFGVALGATLRTPVYIDKRVRGATLVVTIGQVKPHYFAGFGGGAKSILPGVAARLTVGANHAMKIHPRALLGVVNGNIARRDMEDAARLLRGKLFIFNIAMDAEGKPIAAAAGDVVKAHRSLIPWVRKVGQVKATERTDIVIAGQGMPTAMSVYQMTKTVAPAARCVKPGGVIICAGPCYDGIGGTAQACEAIFRIGLIKYMPDNVDVMLVSDMKDLSPLRNLFFDPQPSLDEALSKARAKCGGDASITVLPNAGPLITVAPEEDDSDWDDEFVPRI